MMEVDELVVKYAGWIRKTARRFYSDEFDADDLASETIYKILRQGESYNTCRSFKPWAFTIMGNTFITQYNRKNCVLFTAYEDYEQYQNPLNADQLLNVERILSIIRECGRKSRSIVSVLLYAKGYSYDEIAEIEGIPIGTVKSRIAAGRRILRKALE